MAKKEKRQLNLLDCTPLREPEWTWTERENGLLTLHKVHTSLTDRLIHTVTKKPLRQTHIDLEEIGTFLWTNMDGRKTLRELANLLHEEFGEKVEPLYPRLNQYVVTMKKSGLIFWHVPENKPERK